MSSVSSASAKQDTALNDSIEQGPSSPGNHSGTSSGSYSTMQWVVAWIVLIVVLVLIARTRIGYLLIYYVLALSVLFLLVTQYKWFANVLAPFSSLQPGVVVENATGTSQTAQPAKEAAPTQHE